MSVWDKLRIGVTQMDFNADGKLEANKSFWKTFSLLTGIRAIETTARAC